MSRPRWVRPRIPWWAEAVGWAAVATALLLLLHGFYRRELNHFTGDARWMWMSDNLHDQTPSAGLFFRSVELARRPQRAIAKICGDRQYVLWINGQPAAAGRNRPGFQLDLVDVTDLLGSGSNVIAVEARSPTTVGGVLFALDLFVTAEARRAGDPFGRNSIVSGPEWRVRTRWGEGPARFPDREWTPPHLWGRPPDHPWSYPTPVVHSRTIVQAVVSDPRRLDGDITPTGEPGRWLCRPPSGWQGYLTVALRDGEAPSAFEVEGVDGSLRTVAVVGLEGQDEWLFPGRLRGPFVAVDDGARPAGLAILDALP